MKIQSAILGFGLTSFLAIAGGTNVVTETNWVTAVPWYRDVGGQLYNTQRSILFKPFQGQITAVLTNGVVLQQMHTESITRPVFGDNGGNMMLSSGGPDYIKIGERTVLDGKIFIKNFPIDFTVTVGSHETGRAMPTGREQINGENLPVWDYGVPHRVMVVKTNEPSCNVKSTLPH